MQTARDDKRRKIQSFAYMDNTVFVLSQFLAILRKKHLVFTHEKKIRKIFQNDNCKCGIFLTLTLQEINRD